MKHSTGTPTKAEKARMDRMKEMGQCVACYQRGIHGWGYVEVHHLLSGNRRIGHMATVSLCPWHHRAMTFGIEGLGKEAEKVLGPSLANGSKPFHREFGSDVELLALQNSLLGEA